MRIVDQFLRLFRRGSGQEERQGAEQEGAQALDHPASQSSDSAGSPSFGTEIPRAPEKIVVGLGNPGVQYDSTRHNIGFRVLESWAARHEGTWTEDVALTARVCPIKFAGMPIALIEPQTFMNRSGASVEAALERWTHLDPERDVLVVYDDLDLPTGRIRLRPSGGGGGHNGIGDILTVLDTKLIARLRFGVSRPSEGETSVIDWVLGPFSEQEESEVLPPAIDWAADAIEAVVREGVTSAMGRFNAPRPA